MTVSRTIPPISILLGRAIRQAGAPYRALIDDILLGARSTAYGHAARYLARFEILPLAGEKAADLPDHAPYRAGLLKAYGRKAGLWALVA